jgi:hypothetical protein
MGLHGLSVPSDHKNDYERACSTSEFLEKINCAEGHVMVLGDEPLQSSFFHDNRGLAIARWVYVQVPVDAERLLRKSSDMETLQSPVPFEVTEGKLVLLDSARNGFEIERCQTVDIRPGLYRVTTEGLQSDGKFRFIVHRLVRSAA